MKYICILVFFLSLGSCVSNQKYVFLQKNDVNGNVSIHDSVVRTYAIDSFNYKVQANDILSVRFESLTSKDFDFLSSSSPVQSAGMATAQVNPLLIGEVVDESGNLHFPVIGSVHVAGRTVFEIEDMLREKATKYIDSPQVKVRLINFRVTLLGEINKEGTIMISNNRATLLEVIGLAGGLTDLADRANIKLIRQKGSTVEVQYINVLDENLINSPYFYVHQNDVLIVPALRQRPYRKYFSNNLSLALSTVSIILLVISLSR